MHLKTMEHSIVPQQNNDPDLYRISLKKQQHRQVCKQHVHVYLSDTQTNNKNRRSPTRYMRQQPCGNRGAYL